MSLLGKAKVAITADLSPLKRGLALARRSVVSGMKMMTASIRRMASKVTRLLKRMSIAIVAGIGFSIKAFVSFQEQIAFVNTMLDDQTERLLPKYERELRRMSVEFGESTKTLSRGLFDILSASIDAEKALGVLTVSARAARAGLTTTAVAADAITTILNAYGLEAEKAGEVSDQLFAIVKKGKLVFPELAQNIGKVAAVASIAGLRFEEVGAAIATMTRAGLATDLATTSIRAILNTFLKPMDESIEMAKKFGFELNSTTLQTIGLTGVLMKLKGATAEQVATLFPNIRAMAGFAAALKQAEGMASDLNFIINSSGKTLEAFEKITSTTKFKLDRMVQAIKDVGISIGEVFIGDLNKLADGLVANREVIAEWAVFFANKIRNALLKAKEFILEMVEAFKSGELLFQLMESGKALGSALADGISAALKEKFPNISTFLEGAVKVIQHPFRVAAGIGKVAGTIASGNIGSGFNQGEIKARGFRAGGGDQGRMEEIMAQIEENTRQSPVGGFN